MDSALTNNLLDFLGEPPVDAETNLTTVLRHGVVAQEWLLKTYLKDWLVLLGATVDAEYDLAKAHRVTIRALARFSERIDPALTPLEQIQFLNSIETHLKSLLRHISGYPQERDLQWGIWSRDVPMHIAYGFSEAQILDPVICECIAPVCMLLAFLVSQIVSDSGVAEEIEETMFGKLPRQLLELIRQLPEAPEA